MIPAILPWPILGVVDPRDRLRSAGKRLTDPAEALAQRVAERVVELVVDALDVNALVLRLDLNAVLRRVDVKALLDQVDVDDLISRVDLEALLARVDVNALVQRLDIDGLVERTDLGAVIARSSGGVATEALDAARSQAVGMDQFIDRWVQRALRRSRPAVVAPGGLEGPEPPLSPDSQALSLSQPGHDH
jgi:hypothetical protein